MAGMEVFWGVHVGRAIIIIKCGWDGYFLGMGGRFDMAGIEAHFQKCFALGELWVGLLPEIRAAEIE
eukprot:4058196-Amphidinium_carterae.1